MFVSDAPSASLSHSQHSDNARKACESLWTWTRTRTEHRDFRRTHLWSRARMMPSYWVTGSLLLLLLALLLGTGESSSSSGSSRHRHRVRRWTGTVETQKHGTSLTKKPPDVTKSRKPKTEHLLKVDDHDFTMRPAFGAATAAAAAAAAAAVAAAAEASNQLHLSHPPAISNQMDCPGTEHKALASMRHAFPTDQFADGQEVGPAIPVGVDVQVESLDSISEVDMDFTMTLYLRHYWKDERLSFTSSTNKSMTFDGRLVKKIWVPDVFFVHSKRSFIHDTTTDNIMLRVFPDGHVLYSLRYEADFC
ncbi:hypothetical protein CRUP_018144 [Coryphaenoides rupestris]|nr:hypothetical protein CRUP_018144 [Coryphaenoides rupestris]